MTEKKNRTGAIIKLVVWCIVLSILVSIFAAVMVGSEISFGNGGFMIFGGVFYDDPDSYTVGKSEYRGASGGLDIDIEWNYGNVSFEAYDGEEIKLDDNYNGDEENMMRSKLVGNKLIVKYCRSGVRFFSSIPEKDLTVYIPESLISELGKIKIRSASSSIDAEGIVAKTLDIDTASGKLSLRNSEIGEIDIDCASTEIDIEGVFNDIDIDTASGGVRISGNVGSLEVDSASGNVIFDGGTVRDISVGSASGDCQATLEKLPERLEFDTASGDFELYAPCGKDEGFRVELDTASGEARVIGLDGRTDSGKRITFGKGVYSYKVDSASGSFYYTETE